MHLLLIGGGEIGSQRADGTYRPLETLEIDKYFISKLNKKNPKILFIPTAIELLDPKHLYEQGIRNLYEEKLGCHIDSLYLSTDITKSELQKKINSCDAIYISGGDTNYMMKRWHETGLDILLQQEALNGKMIAGISAGAMCWFEKVLTENKDGRKTLLDGLNLIPNMCVPHWNRYKSFLDDPLAKSLPFIAIDNCCAIEIVENSFNIIKSTDDASAYLYCFDKNFTCNNITKEAIGLI